MSNLHGVSIVIRSLNESKYIEQCLFGIFSQKVIIPVEVIVVDSGSTDGTLEIVRKYRCKIVHIKKSDFTFGHALNVGVAETIYPIVVSISAHCVPIGNMWLNALIKPLLEESAEMVFGSHVAGCESRTSEKNYFRSKFTINPGLCQRPLFNNGNSAFLKKLWLLRPFDTKLPAQEDMDFSKWHKINSNARLIFENQASVIHYHNDKNWSLYRRLYREYSVEFFLGENSLRYLFAFLFRLPFAILKDCQRARNAGVLFKALRGVLTFRLFQLLAYIYAAINFKNFVEQRDVD